VGWFKMAADTANDSSPRLVSVRRTEDGKVAGGGVVLGPDTVLTCAHVVNDALGRSMFDPRSPGVSQIWVELGDDDCEPQRHVARVSHWVPPRSRGGGQVRVGDGEWLSGLPEVLRVILR
jgi:hypothetical protein